LQEIYTYWQSLLNGRPMPARKDVDPVQLPRHLPDLMLIDVLHDPRRFRYRLVGSRIVSASAEDRTGRFFDDVSFFKKNTDVIEHYNAVVEKAVPHITLEPFLNFSNNMTYQAKRLLLPLSSDGKTVDMLMAYFRFTTGPYAKN
jgi:hypothetical protein